MIVTKGGLQEALQVFDTFEAVNCWSTTQDNCGEEALEIEGKLRGN